ncbi:hypothetical protein BC332_10404 [Capsicum chinense]|nr:hypothetical protein BC332_10404 [Capsicum chinense]
MKPTLRCGCPVINNNTNLVPLDLMTPEFFDKFYYNDLIRNQGLFFSDQVLMGSSVTADVVHIDVVENVVPLLVGSQSNDEVDIGNDENENRSLNEDLNSDETDLSSSESNMNDDDIPDKDDSSIDEELIAFRAKNSSKKKSKSREEIPVGEAGIDKGFKDIGRNKKDRYMGRLGGDEEYIDSSACDSVDSTNLLDQDVVGGVDFPRRRKSNKIRFDNDCGVVVF